jgi:hypothetical protein
MIKKILKYLSSMRFTVLLISLLGLMFLMGLWIPQKRLVKGWYQQWQAHSPKLVAALDAFQLTDIYTSPLMVALWFFFFLNLALVMWQRWPVMKGRIALSEAKIANPETAGGYSFRNSYLLPRGLDGAGVIGYLGKHGYKVIGSGSGFYGVKNRLSPIASGLFHISFFLLLLGGITSVYTQFIGYLDLAEGENFQGEVERYVQSPPPTLPKIGSIPKVAFTIKSIVPLASGFTETGLKVQVVDGRGQNHTLDINKPYIADSTSFVLKNLGPAPLFVLKDPSGKEIDGAYMKLNVLKGRKDRFALGGFEFTARFFSDYALEDGKPVTRSSEFKNPTFIISVARQGVTIAESAVPRNGAMEFAGYRLEMREMPLWVRFSVLKEHGIGIVYSGFALASLAVVWRLLFYRRELVGAVREEQGGCRLYIAARAEFYKSLSDDEFAPLFEQLAAPGSSPEHVEAVT